MFACSLLGSDARWKIAKGSDYLSIIEQVILDCRTFLKRIAFERNFTYRIRSIKHLFYTERLAILILEPLELRRLKNDLLMCYKILNNLAPISPADHFTKRTDTSIHTRTSGTGLLLKSFCRTNRIGNHFVFRSIEAWNTLPCTITNATFPLMFKLLQSTWDVSPFLVRKLYYILHIQRI